VWLALSSFATCAVLQDVFFNTEMEGKIEGKMERISPKIKPARDDCVIVPGRCLYDGEVERIVGSKAGIKRGSIHCDEGLIRMRTRDALRCFGSRDIGRTRLSFYCRVIIYPTVIVKCLTV
jgi:hypothetical protein